MHADLPRIRELQEVDNQIRELEEEIRRLPKYIAEIEKQLKTHKIKIVADQNALAENTKNHRTLESDIVVHQQKVSRLRDQMNEAKTNNQFHAFQHEIEFEEKAIHKVEDHILDKMVEAETLLQNVNKAEATLKIENEKAQRQVVAARAKITKDEVATEAVRARRVQLAAALDAKVLRIYENVSKTRNGVAVARASADLCLACNVLFRPQFKQILRSHKQVLTCESCGRILYYEPPGEVELQDSASSTP